MKITVYKKNSHPVAQEKHFDCVFNSSLDLGELKKIANSNETLRILLLGDSNQRKMFEAFHHCSGTQLTQKNGKLNVEFLPENMETFYKLQDEASFFESSIPKMSVTIKMFNVILVQSNFWSLMHYQRFCHDCHSRGVVEGKCLEYCPLNFVWKNENQRLPLSFVRLKLKRIREFLHYLNIYKNATAKLVFQTAPLPRASSASSNRSDGWVAGSSVHTYVEEINDLWRLQASIDGAILLDAASLFRGTPFEVSHEDDMHLQPDAQLALLNILLKLLTKH